MPCEFIEGWLVCMIINMPVKTFVHNEKYYFYDAYKNNVIHVSKGLYKEIHKLLRMGTNSYSAQENKTPEYYEIMHLIRKGYFKADFIEKIEHPFNNMVDSLIDRGLNSIILQVSCECNFNCRYCLFAVDNNIDRIHNKQRMSFPIAKKSIDFLYDHSKDSDVVTISFYGGEPLLNFELIKQVVKYANEKFEFKHIIYSMTSNFSLMTDEILKFLVMHNFRLTISMDGPEKIQNDHKKFLNTGTNTYEVVTKNVNKLREKSKLFFNQNVQFNAVIFRHESYKEVLSFFNSLGIDSNQITCTYAYMSGIDYTQHYSSRTPSSDIKNDIHIYDIVDEIMDKKLIAKMETALNNKGKIPSNWHHNGPCIPGINRLFVNVNGELYPCERIIETTCTIIGNVYEGLDAEKVKNIMNVGHLTKQKCKDCWAMRFCDLCASKCVDIDNNCFSETQKEHMCEYVRHQAQRYITQFILAKNRRLIDE